MFGDVPGQQNQGHKFILRQWVTTDIQKHLAEVPLVSKLCPTTF
jgi:hypothetical protein